MLLVTSVVSNHNYHSDSYHFELDGTGVPCNGSHSVFDFAAIFEARQGSSLNLDLSNCHFKESVTIRGKWESIRLEGTLVEGDVIFQGIKGSGECIAPRIRVNGSFRVEEAIETPEDDLKSLDLDNAVIGVNLSLRSVKIKEKLDLSDASVGRSVHFKPYRQKLEIGADCANHDRFCAKIGYIFARGLRVANDVDLRCANVFGTCPPAGTSINFENLRCTSLLMDAVKNSNSNGAVFRVIIEHQLKLTGARIEGHLHLMGARIGGGIHASGIFVAGAFKCQAFKDFCHTEIGESTMVDFRDQFYSIYAPQATVGGYVSLSGTKCASAVVMPRAEIGGGLYLNPLGTAASSFGNHWHGTAEPYGVSLYMPYSTIRGTIYLGDILRATRSNVGLATKLYFTNSTIARLVGPSTLNQVEGWMIDAIVLDHATILGDVQIPELNLHILALKSATVRGTVKLPRQTPKPMLVRAKGVQISGDFDLVDSSIQYLQLDGCTIGRNLLGSGSKIVGAKSNDPETFKCENDELGPFCFDTEIIGLSVQSSTIRGSASFHGSFVRCADFALATIHGDLTFETLVEDKPTSIDSLGQRDNKSPQIVGLWLRSATIYGKLNVRGCEIYGGICLLDATIHGLFDLSATSNRGTTVYPLKHKRFYFSIDAKHCRLLSGIRADPLEVGGSITQYVSLIGEVDLTGSEVATIQFKSVKIFAEGTEREVLGHLNMRACRVTTNALFDRCMLDSLVLSQMIIGSSLSLQGLIQNEYQPPALPIEWNRLPKEPQFIVADQIDVKGDFNVSIKDGHSVNGLQAVGATIRGSVLVKGNFDPYESVGSKCCLNVSGSSVAGSFEIEESSKLNGLALLTNCRIENKVFLKGSFGNINISQLVAGSSLEISNVKQVGTTNEFVTADQIDVKGDLNISVEPGTFVKGLQAVGATIGGSVSLEGHFRTYGGNAPQTFSARLTSSTIAGALEIKKGSTFSTGLSLANCRIENSITIKDSEFKNGKWIPEAKAALLLNGVKTNGIVVITNCKIRGNALMDSAEFNKSFAIDLENTVRKLSMESTLVDSELRICCPRLSDPPGENDVLRPIWSIEENLPKVNLKQLRCGTLSIDLSAWPRGATEKSWFATNVFKKKGLKRYDKHKKEGAKFFVSGLKLESIRVTETRSQEAVQKEDEVLHLVDNRKPELADYYRKTGIFVVMSLLVVSIVIGTLYGWNHQSFRSILPFSTVASICLIFCIHLNLESDRVAKENAAGRADLDEYEKLRAFLDITDFSHSFYLRVSELVARRGLRYYSDRIYSNMRKEELRRVGSSYGLVGSFINKLSGSGTSSQSIGFVTFALFGLVSALLTAALLNSPASPIVSPDDRAWVFLKALTYPILLLADWMLNLGVMPEIKDAKGVGFNKEIFGNSYPWFTFAVALWRLSFAFYGFLLITKLSGMLRRYRPDGVDN